VYDSMSAPHDVERGTLVTSAVCITVIIHCNCCVYELCLSVFVTSDTCAEGGARTVPYAVVDRCRSLAMENSACCVPPTGQVSHPPHSFHPNVLLPIPFVGLMRYGCVMAMAVGCTSWRSWTYCPSRQMDGIFS